MRWFLFSLLFFILTVAVNGQPASFDLSNYGVRIEPDRRVMAVLATLEMAIDVDPAGQGAKLINTPLSDKGVKFRELLLADNAGLSADLRRRISMFIAQHKKRHPAATDADFIAPFISMAYTLSPAPDLADPAIVNDLPGSVLDVLDFAPLVREFYRASFKTKIDDYVKQYNAASDQTLRPSSREMVSELLDYLHTKPRLFFSEKVKVSTTPPGKKKPIETIETREHERRFFIVPEMLMAASTISFLNVRDDYYVIVPPDSDLIFSDARRAFLQFVVDPLVLTNTKEIAAVRDWAKPILDERRKTNPSISPDIHLVVSRSLVTAIDVRQREFLQSRIATDQARQKLGRLKTDEEKRAVTAELEKFKRSLADESALDLYEDHQRGWILDFYFAEQLKGIEDSGFDIAASLREMIAAFDPAKEPNRAESSSEARTRALAAREDRRKTPDTRTAGSDNPVTVRLLEIEKVIDTTDYVKANAGLKQLQKEFPSEPRVYYALGRVASLAAKVIDDPEEQAPKLLEAKAAYSNVLSTATATTDKALLSLTYVALGRLYEHFDDRDYAIKLYDEAIKIGEVANGGFNEAMAAKQKLLRP